MAIHAQGRYALVSTARSDSRGAKVVWWAHRFMIVFGLCWISAGIYFGVDAYRQVEQSVAVKGTVVALERFSSSASRYPVIRYVDLEGHAHTLKSKSGSNPPSHFVGEKVRILIDPNDPGFADHAMIDSFFDLWGGAIFMIGFGAAFVLITLFVSALESRDEKGTKGLLAGDLVGKMVNLFLVIGIGFSVMGIYSWNNTNDFVSKAVRVNGTVVALMRQVGSFVEFPVVRYTDHQGQVRKFYSTSGSSNSPYSVGDKVKILIDPTRPNFPATATIDSFFALWGASVVLLVLGGAFVLIPLAFKYIDSRGGEIEFGRRKREE